MTCKEIVKVIGIEYKLISEYLNELGLQPAYASRYTPKIVSNAVRSNCQILNSALLDVADLHAENLKGLRYDDNYTYFLAYAVIDSMSGHEFYSKAEILRKVNKLKASLL